MIVKTFYDEQTFTLSYIVYDELTKDSIIIDPVWDYDPKASKTSTISFEKIDQFIQEKQLIPHYCLETHAHADHLSASVLVKQKYPHIKLAISEDIKIVQDVFKGIFNMKSLETDGSQFDELLTDNQILTAGSIEVKVMKTPGHTPACMSFLIEDNLFTGDALFMPDYGTGRCDFPKGSATDLYNSITKKIYSLPDNTKIFVGHDYQPNGRELKWETTVGESKQNNKQLNEKVSKEEFINMRQQRDATLNAPVLLLQSVQVNINAGKLPESEDNNRKYLKIPIE